MSNIDQFESTFRSASREVYHFNRVPIARVLIVSDQNGETLANYSRSVKEFLSFLNHDNQLEWLELSGDQFTTAADLLERVKQIQPDLICTYRNLQTTAWEFPYSLGVHLDVLLQRTPVPVLMTPHPLAGRQAEHAMHDSKTVMAVTSHLNKDFRLVDYAATMTERKGCLFLTHIEDERTFNRYVNTMQKVSEIATDRVAELLKEQLLKDPLEYIESCQKGLKDAQADVDVQAIVTFGRHLDKYREQISEQKLSLLVMNAKDEEQLAMQGLAYELAIEFREIPLLLL
ncbi:MAG: hypothetical protein ACWA5R_06485 [bacterium]